MNLNKYRQITEKHPKEFKLFKDVIFPVTMHWEGGGRLHKVSGDSGGWTIWGITWNNFRHLFRDFNDFKDTTREEAAYIAFVLFYLKIHADKVPYDCKLYYFDMAYNLGTRRAIKYMQKCIGVKPDGIIGKITISQMDRLKEICLKKKRDSWYWWLNKNRRRLKKFYRGWINRSNFVYNKKY